MPAYVIAFSTGRGHLTLMPAQQGTRMGMHSPATRPTTASMQLTRPSSSLMAPTMPKPPSITRLLHPPRSQSRPIQASTRRLRMLDTAVGMAASSPPSKQAPIGGVAAMVPTPGNRPAERLQLLRCGLALYCAVTSSYHTCNHDWTTCGK